jgi:predicted nucleic acid-binding protein
MSATGWTILGVFGIVIVAILVLMLAPVGPALPEIEQAGFTSQQGLLNNIIGNL